MSKEDLRRSPLHEFHQEQGARFVPFAGWEMPVQYSSILEEHRKTRESAGLFDVSHMGEMEVTGTEAEAFLNHIITNDLTQIVDGQALYSPACYEDGGVVDDLILYRIAKDNFLICCNASNSEKVYNWLVTHCSNFSCAVRDASENYAQLALQGPNAVKILESIIPDCGSNIKRFHFLQCDILGNPCLLSRTGYTGEDGFEIYLPPAASLGLAREILERGYEEGVRPIGLGARDSLRLEAGLPLYGHEISRSISPIEGGIGWTVKLSKEDNFIGKKALESVKNESSPKRLIHFKCEGKRIARQGCLILADGQKAGEVLSGTFSPMTECAIGSALVELEKVKDANLAADIRGKSIPITRTKPPLHKRI